MSEFDDEVIKSILRRLDFLDRKYEETRTDFREWKDRIYKNTPGDKYASLDKIVSCNKKDVEWLVSSYKQIEWHLNNLYAKIAELEGV